MTFDVKTYRFTGRGGVGTAGLVVGGLGLAASVAGYLMDHAHFFHAWLVAFTFWVSIALGALFFTMLHHLTAARWSIVVRRVSEAMMAPLPWMFLAAIPVFLGVHELYHWSHVGATAHDAVLTSKSPFLNTSFFVVRTVIYFLIWSGLSFMLYRTSLAQDRDGYSEAQVDRMKRISAPGMVLFAITVTFAGFDWLMSLDPHWYSTIYGVYFFSGGLLGAIAAFVLFINIVRRPGMLDSTITVEHQHDLGKLMLAFVIFWSYIGFSQFLLQWYGNLPEESVWYLDRMEHGWGWVSLIILFGHFVFPFLVLLFRGVKRSRLLLSLMAVWVLLMHLVDMFWLVFPTLMPEQLQIGAVDLVSIAGTMAALGGLFLWMVWRNYTSHAAVPVNDPKLQQSIEFVNF